MISITELKQEIRETKEAIYEYNDCETLHDYYVGKLNRQKRLITDLYILGYISEKSFNNLYEIYETYYFDVHYM